MPVIFGCTIILILLIHFRSRNNPKSREDIVKEFLQKELEANTTRKKDISGLAYQTIDPSRLPDLSGVPDKEGEIAAICQTLKTLEGKQMLNLSGISNTDLKLSYGAANFPFLSECDARFTTFSRKLYELGAHLFAAGEEEKAVQVLEYTVESGSDIASAYRLLGSLYAKNGEDSALLALRKKAQELPETIRDSVLRSLDG
ncbi:MAG: hypothetical protein K2N63_10365 [Lachnospiraceae bacterium]|nr:hypothetical protein [Lachnospiraceae bacterium]